MCIFLGQEVKAKGPLKSRLRVNRRVNKTSQRHNSNITHVLNLPNSIGWNLHWMAMRSLDIVYYLSLPCPPRASTGPICWTVENYSPLPMKNSLSAASAAAGLRLKGEVFAALAARKSSRPILYLAQISKRARGTVFWSPLTIPTTMPCYILATHLLLLWFICTTTVHDLDFHPSICSNAFNMLAL
jgi:hypothetical protein